MIKKAVNTLITEIIMFILKIVLFNMLPKGIKPAIKRVNLNI
jgi:hypothetical protein